MNAPTSTDVDQLKDYFSERDGVRFAGTHLLVDLWDTARLDDAVHIEAALRGAAHAAGATVLHAHLHVFTPQGGITGVLLLAESHITIHTWPERGFAAIDLFMCAACNPADALPALQTALQPDRMNVKSLQRGLPG
jgi:S-adenosylmethionine decarboxylase